MFRCLNKFMTKRELRGGFVTFPKEIFLDRYEVLFHSLDEIFGPVMHWSSPNTLPQTLEQLA